MSLKTIYDKYDKEAINNLPAIVFDGKIFTIVTAKEAHKAVDYLLKQSILGIDTETRPTFRKGDFHQVALLQVSSKDTCFLFRLNFTGLTTHLIRLLEDTTVPKVGLSLHDDILALQRRAKFTPGCFIDLQDCVKDIGIKDMSLQKIYANLFHQKISKNQRLTNWAQEVLTDSQKGYAATDAWACIKIYEELLRLKQSGEYNLVVTETEAEE